MIAFLKASALGVFRLSRTILIVIAWLTVNGLMVALATIGVGIWLLGQYENKLPDYQALQDYQLPETSRFFAGDASPLAEYATERRHFVPVNAIPPRIVDAFLAAEDKNFYEHYGIDPTGIARALISNIGKAGEGKRPAGASTITQQVAKNFLVGNEMSFDRKIREAITALRMERVLSKDRILEIYLNGIFLGARSYGVAAAAETYFGKPLAQVSVAEAAYLAALPKAPSNYHPVRNRQAAIERRNWVIGRMLEDRRITDAEARAALAEPLTTRTSLPREETKNSAARDYFAEEARREIVKRYGEQALYEGGLRVRTTMDPRLQQAAMKALRGALVAYDHRHGWRGPVTRLDAAHLVAWRAALGEITPPSGTEGWSLAVVIGLDKDAAHLGLPDGTTGALALPDLRWARRAMDEDRLGPEIRKPADALAVGDVVLVEPIFKDEKGRDLPSGSYALRQVPEVQGGMVAIDPHSGRVLALAGGWSAAGSSFNRAVQAMRQPGSSIKPFVYLTALENGFTPSSLILDAPYEYNPGHGQPIWRPENYGGRFYGPTPLRVGIEKSRNVITVRLAEAVGMNKVSATVEKFGIVDKLPPFLPMTLGAAETTVLRLTTAYAMLANGGRRIEPSILDRVVDRHGRVLYVHDARSCETCGAPWAPALALPDLPAKEQAIADPRAVYQMISILEGVVQRGTAARLKSLKRPVAGKTGTTNDAKDAWFVGFTPDLAVGVYLGFDQPRSLGERETGGAAAVPAFEDMMMTAFEGAPGLSFRQPKGLRMVRVNPATGAIAGPDDKSVIWESFIAGTEPEDGNPRPVLGGETKSETHSSEAPVSTGPTMMGTGSLY